MFNLRRKSEANSIYAQLSGKMAGATTKVQRSAANYLNRRFASLTRKAQKRAFLLFLIVLVTIYSLVTINAVNQPPGASPALPTSTKVHYPVLPQPEETPHDPATDSAAFIAFRRAMDSLSQTPDGKKQVDAFIRSRKGFLESLKQAEQKLK